MTSYREGAVIGTAIVFGLSLLPYFIKNKDARDVYAFIHIFWWATLLLTFLFNSPAGMEEPLFDFNLVPRDSDEMYWLSRITFYIFIFQLMTLFVSIPVYVFMFEKK